MDGIAFRLGPLTVRWYGILINIGIILGAYLAYREAKRQGEKADDIIDLLFYVLPAAIIGARLYYVIFNWEFFRSNLSAIPKTWHGGLAIHGGVLGGILAGYVFTRRRDYNFWQWADFTAPAIMLGQSIGRLGNYINQEAYGYVTDVPWAMYIAGAYRHPTFLYEIVWNLGVLSFLLIWRHRGQVFHGEIMALYALLYSSGRIWIEAFRTDSLMWGNFRVAQLISGVLILLSATFIIQKRHKHKVNR